MTWYEWITLCSLGIFLGTSLFYALRLIRLGKPVDKAPASGSVAPAVRYSMSGAMNPAKKESAYLHLPTYGAGILYHLGTFLSLLLFFFIWMQLPFSRMPVLILSGFLVLSSSCGIGILIKRGWKNELRALSNPDDYISNILVTLFQVGTFLALSIPELLPFYFLETSILFLYFPLSKLKHVIYFFAARYHLGFFFGRRGVWPPGNG
ncbi:MAG: hypothetical protein IH596_00135 [Bacteroidales bacterium]|nr:hypothetical protein [Bacteroidales bacterium]